jgi:CheY-like chemotaxis protein
MIDIAGCEGSGTGFAILLDGDDMRDARLNLLLTSPPPGGGYERGQSWRQTVAQLLMPMGVRTFEADSGPAAVELMERHPIHMAVVDTRLPAISGLNVLQLMQRLKEHGQKHLISPLNRVISAQNQAHLGPSEAKKGLPEIHSGKSAQYEVKNDSVPQAFQFHMQVEERSQSGMTQRRIEVRFEARVSPPRAAVPQSPGGPVVILIAPPPGEQDRQLLAEALKFNAFSVLNEPVDVEVALEVMARAMKRIFSGQWPVVSGQ